MYHCVVSYHSLPSPQHKPLRFCIDSMLQVSVLAIQQESQAGFHLWGMCSVRSAHDMLMLPQAYMSNTGVAITNQETAGLYHRLLKHINNCKLGSVLWLISALYTLFSYVMTHKYRNYTMIQFKVLLVTEEQGFAAGKHLENFAD